MSVLHGATAITDKKPKRITCVMGNALVRQAQAPAWAHPTLGIVLPALCGPACFALCRYRAPELLLGPPFQDKSNVTVQSLYGPPVDMWAIGCLMVRTLHDT